MKVFVSLGIPESGIQSLIKAGVQVTRSPQQTPLTSEDLHAACRGHDILLSSSADVLDAGFLERNTQIRFISQFSAGYDNIDLDKARELGIQVANSPGTMTDATADIAFGLLLAVSRKMCFMHKSILRGEWGPFNPTAHLGMELKGKTLGIFGLGRIGMEFARRCQGAYGMQVCYTNRSPNRIAEKELRAQPVSFDALLRQSDIISVHAALTDETRGIFNKEAFERMKPEAIFLNTARGGIHHEADLIDALNNGKIWGTGLDVTDPEPMSPDNPLLSMESVAVTPHIGSATVEARNAMALAAAGNIIQFIRQEPITNRLI